MIRATLTAAIATVSMSVASAETGWQQYLCRYGPDGSGRVQLLRINEGQSRVQFLPEQRDAADVKVYPERVSFLSPRGFVWVVQKDGRFYGIDPNGGIRGTCTAAPD